MDPDWWRTSDLKLPIYWWTNNAEPPRAVVVAIHGFADHGDSFDSLARRLADSGIAMLAFDTRGCGRWRDTNWLPESNSEKLVAYSGGKRTATLDYQQTVADLAAIVNRMHEIYPDLPVFLLGESMGADTAISAIATKGVSTDGVILANPAIRFHSGAWVRSIPVFAHSLLPGKSLDLRPNLSYVINDDQIYREKRIDPLLVNSVNKGDYFRILAFLRFSRRCMKQVPDNVPVLVLVSQQDNLLSSKGAFDLFASIKSTDKTMKSMPSHSHILLETTYISTAASQAVLNWIIEHVPILESKQAQPEEREGSLATQRDRQPARTANQIDN